MRKMKEWCGNGVHGNSVGMVCTGIVLEWCWKGVGRVWEGCGKGLGKVWEGCGNGA